jgi:hypothetical protein
MRGGPGRTAFASRAVIVRTHRRRYSAGMNTLAEIAAAAERLPMNEQHELVKQLTSKSRVQPRVLSRAEREAWMAELAELAKRGSTGRHSISIEQILDESREERL